MYGVEFTVVSICKVFENLSNIVTYLFTGSGDARIQLSNSLSDIRLSLTENNGFFNNSYFKLAGHPITLTILGLFTTLVTPQIILDILCDTLEITYSGISSSIHHTYNYISSTSAYIKDFVYSTADDIADYFYSPSTPTPQPYPMQFQHLLNIWLTQV